MTCATCKHLSGKCNNWPKLGRHDSCWEPIPVTLASNIRGMNDYELAVFMSKVKAQLHLADADNSTVCERELSDNIRFLTKEIEQL